MTFLCRFGEAKSYLKKNLVIIVLILITGMILLTCRNDTINYDEFFSMQWSRMNWKDYIARLMVDTHPPLHDIFLKAINDISGGNIYIARLFSAMCAIALFWTAGLFTRKEFGDKVSIFFILFLYMNNLMIQKSCEIRMYSLATLLCLANAIFFYKLIKNPKRSYWIGFVCFGVAAAYTQFFGILCMCFTYIGVLTYFIWKKEKKQVRNWFIAAAATVVAYLPWVYFAFGQVVEVSGDFWIEMPTSRLGPLKEMFTTKYAYSYWIYLAVLVLLTGWTIVDFIIHKDEESFWSLVCALTLWGVYVIAYLFSYFFQPILLSRYLLMGFAITLLGVSRLVKRVNGLVLTAILLIISYLGISMVIHYAQEQFNKNTTAFRLYAEHNIDTDDEIVFVYRNIQHYFEHFLLYYVPQAKIHGFETLDEMKAYLDDMDSNKSDVSTWIVDFANDEVIDELTQIDEITLTDMGEHYISTEGFRLYTVR